MQHEQLDPSVRDFRDFVKRHPKLVREVRAGQATWNGLYQDWVILGDDERHWASYKDGTDHVHSDYSSSSIEGLLNGNQTVGSLVKKLGEMNVNDVQNYLNQFSGVMGNVQELMNQFQTKPGSGQRRETYDQPFSFRGF
ncbi:YlbD family protein [Natribacillus halophilus]|uniref:YlbD family protein n=1 Tax=Natribacillus halophilus TaxID=549003 RepID=UPI0015A179EA|nr:YlbD family protein [Natribacillus halophilus]